MDTCCFFSRPLPIYSLSLSSFFEIISGFVHLSVLPFPRPSMHHSILLPLAYILSTSTLHWSLDLKHFLDTYLYFSSVSPYILLFFFPARFQILTAHTSPWEGLDSFFCGTLRSSDVLLLALVVSLLGENGEQRVILANYDYHEQQAPDVESSFPSPRRYTTLQLLRIYHHHHLRNNHIQKLVLMMMVLALVVEKWPCRSGGGGNIDRTTCTVLKDSSLLNLY